MLFLFLLVFVLILLILLSVAFLTLWERHVLGLTQNRLGPNKVTFFGLFQPLLDGLNLLKKELLLPFHANRLIMLSTPLLAFVLLGFELIVVPFPFNSLSLSLSLLFFLVVLGFSVYPLILVGITANSKFAFVGSLRASSQTVSFEVLFSLLILGLLFFYGSLALNFGFNLAMLTFLPVFFTSVLVELNRAPFDFAEGESELVSGFNVELSSTAFVLFFLKEYASCIIFAVLTSVLFFNFSLVSLLILLAFILYVRSSFPRFRFDLLMRLFWLNLLPLVINFLVVVLLLLSWVSLNSTADSGPAGTSYII